MSGFLKGGFLKSLLAIIFIAACAFSSGLALLADRYRDAAVEVCSRIDENYYLRAEVETQEFLIDCYNSARTQKFLLSREANIERLNHRLEGLRSSHLAVWSPQDNQQMWENRSVDTGIRSRMIEDQLVVFSVLKGSAAEKAGVKVGDAIVSVNDYPVNSAFDARTWSGNFVLLREAHGEQKGELKMRIEATEIAEDLSPVLRDLGGGVGQLVLGSFLPQYFEDKKWLPIANELSHYKKIILDVRNNSGGSYPAMLRAASPFLCDRTPLGSLYFAKGTAVGDMLDELSVEAQIAQISKVGELRLKGFESYGCFKGKFAVLIDAETSSTAEIFARGLQDHSKVYGRRSSGQVVMAKWFHLPALGDERYSISIPIAGYRTKNGQTLEGSGVQPDKLFDYDLKRARLGRDSWLEDLVRVL